MTSLKRDLVVVAAAVSAGIHGALAPDHLRERAAAGGGFVAATLLLATSVVLLTHVPESVWALVVAALVFAGLLAGYALAVTIGLPLLHPEPEPVDGLGLVTKAVEAVGLALSLDLVRSRRPARLPFSPDRTGGLRT